MQSNLAKQLAKLVKVKYVEDISAASRVGMQAECAYAHANIAGVACFWHVAWQPRAIHVAEC